MFTSILYSINTPEPRRNRWLIRLRNNIPLLYFLWTTTWDSLER